MFGLNQDQFLGFLRHLVTFVGGILVARGKLDPAAVETIGGAVVTLIGFLFSAMTPEKRKTESEVTEVASPPPIPPPSTKP